jgi:hypothetical protein
MLSISYFLVLIPLQITFALYIYDYFLTYITLNIIIADNFIALNTGFYYKGALICDRISILVNYVKNRLIFDILSLIPFLINNSSVL